MGSIAGFLSPSVREELNSATGTALPAWSPPPRYETRFLRKDGKEIWVELFVSQINWDNIPSVLVSVVDIDSQKRAPRMHWPRRKATTAPSSSMPPTASTDLRWTAGTCAPILHWHG